MTQKALLQSAGDGTAVPSGYVGEILGSTLKSGTGGFTYSTTISGSISATNNVPYTVASQTLNKGSYLVCLNSSFNIAAGSTRSCDLQLFIGGTNITPNYYYSNPGTNSGTADIGMVIPIVITQDSTLVEVKVRITGGNDTVIQYGQLSFIRIA